MDSQSDDLTRAVEQLAAADTAEALREAHRHVRRQLRAARAAEQLGPLAQTYRAAMRLWDAQKAEGISLEERQRGLEQSLRAAWPQTREWHYLCSACDDYGLVIAQCPGGEAQTSRRPRVHTAHNSTWPCSRPHTYGWPCSCPAGARFRSQPKPEPTDFHAAGKSK